VLGGIQGSDFSATHSTAFVNRVIGRKGGHHLEALATGTGVLGLLRASEGHQTEPVPQPYVAERKRERFIQDSGGKRKNPQQEASQRRATTKTQNQNEIVPIVRSHLPA